MTADQLSRTFAALADPTRRALLVRLVRGAAPVPELAEPLLREMSLPAVTKHLKVLERAGLITVVLTAEGQDQTRVTVTWEPFGGTTKEELETFINARTGMTQGWTGSFDKLEAYLSQV